MPNKRVLVFVFLIVDIVAGLWLAPAALAHNAGHVHPQPGVCIDVGGGNHAANPQVQDKMPDTSGDQFGTRWAAEQSPAVFPYFCDDPRAQPHDH